MSSASVMKSGSGEELTYIPALDGVRALSVVLVMMYHWPYTLLQVPFGWVGVQIFFVLSGYLITRGLLNLKSRTLAQYLISFYMKRALRIFPLYYGYLLLLSIIYLAASGKSGELAAAVVEGLAELPRNWIYLYTYTYNFMEGINWWLGRSVEHSRFFNHLWSLAVEEQFYLFFPLVVFFLSKDALRKLLIAVLLICPLFRYIAGEWLLALGAGEGLRAATVYRATIFQIDSLAAGALLATGASFFFKYARAWFHVILILIVVVGTLNAYAIGTTYFGFGLESPETLLTNYRHVYAFSMVNICALMFIAASVPGVPVYPFLARDKVVYIGRISYGIYLIHLPVVMLIKYLFPREMILANPLLEFPVLLLYFVCVFLLAHLSFKYFESGFLKIKKRFS